MSLPQTRADKIFKMREELAIARDSLDTAANLAIELGEYELQQKILETGEWADTIHRRAERINESSN